MIYLDYAATTPICEEALNTYEQASRMYYGNASSLHDIGSKAEDALQQCRLQHSLFIKGEKEGVYFTSGGSESNVLSILSILKANKRKGKHLITTKVEHASLFHLFQQLEKEGYDVTYLGVNEHGMISLEELKNAIRTTTLLASIHHANSEIGAIQPLEAIGEILHSYDIIFHTDCVQTYGEIPIDVKKWHIDSLSVSSHKIYGPKGCGLAYIAPHIAWKSVLDKTTHEKGFRSGTVDVPSILAFTAAAQKVMQTMPKRAERYKNLRSLFVKLIRERIPQVMIEQSLEAQLPQIIAMSFSQVQGQYMMLECNRHGICVSTGSACQVGMEDPSRTMLAIGKTPSEAKQFVRLSMGNETTEEEVEKTVDVIEAILQSISIDYK